MTWRLTQPVLLALIAAAWPDPAVVVAAPAAGSHAGQMARVEQGAGPLRSPSETDTPGVRQPGGPMDCALCAGRTGQPCVDPRLPGVETWPGPAGCEAAGASSSWTSRLRPGPTISCRLRLHILLCTWLI